MLENEKKVHFLPIAPKKRAKSINSSVPFNAALLTHMQCTSWMRCREMLVNATYTVFGTSSSFSDLRWKK